MSILSKNVCVHTPMHAVLVEIVSQLKTWGFKGLYAIAVTFRSVYKWEENIMIWSLSQSYYWTITVTKQKDQRGTVEEKMKKLAWDSKQSHEANITSYRVYTWDAGIPNGGFMCCTTTPAPDLCFVTGELSPKYNH